MDIEEKLEEICSKLEEIDKKMDIVAANSQVVVAVVTSHGDAIARLEKMMMQLQIECPVLKPKSHTSDDNGENDRDRVTTREYDILEAKAEKK